MMGKNMAVILAGGLGSRMQAAAPKQMVLLAGKPLIQYSLAVFSQHAQIDGIIIVSHQDSFEQVDSMVNQGSYDKVADIIRGGTTRQESSRLGVMAVADDYDNVLIHDAARPFILAETIDILIQQLTRFGAVGLAAPLTDTVAVVTENGLVSDIPERTYLRTMQTPQAFHLDIIRKAHQLALAREINQATDDCTLVNTFRLTPVFMAPGQAENIKITYSHDMMLAEKILQLRELAGGDG